MTGLKTTLADFNTSLAQLKVDELLDKDLEQSHFGDYLMIEEDINQERYRVWLNHPESVDQGEAPAEIEYAGKQNDHRWETIARIYE